MKTINDMVGFFGDNKWVYFDISIYRTYGEDNEIYNKLVRSKLVRYNELRQSAIEDVKELRKEKQKYELGLNVDGSNLSIDENLRKQSLWIPLQIVEGKIEYIMHKFDLTEDDVK